MASGHCIANPTTCKSGEQCGAGTVCNSTTGKCEPVMRCGELPVCGKGTVCSADGRCLPDCRGDIAGICGLGQLCNQTSGACEDASLLVCGKLPGLCTADQSCDPGTGYCREKIIDYSLAYDVQLYDLSIDLNSKKQGFQAKLKVFLVATSDGTSKIDFDIGMTQTVSMKPYVPYSVSAVTDESGAPLTFNADAAKGLLSVMLKSPLNKDQGAVVAITYGGDFNTVTDEMSDFFYVGLMQRQGKKSHMAPIIQTFGWPNFARNWLPSHDHPSDIARFTVDVGIDNDFTVLSNGVMLKEGNRRRTFVLREPVPTYAMHIVASDFVKVPIGVVDGIEVNAYVYPSDTAVPGVWWSSILAELKYLKERLGPYPFDTYNMIEVPSAFGGMEHATVISVADTLLDRPDDFGRIPVMHELIHHYFGDNAHQLRWEEFWLNESLGAYYEADVQRGTAGIKPYLLHLDAKRQLVWRKPKRFDGFPLRYTSDPERVPNVADATFNAPYFKGAWVWHMLRIAMGETSFAALQKKFYESSRFGKYDTKGLLALANTVSGKDFTKFFDEWVYQRGWPQMNSAFTYDGTKKQITLTVKQVQDTAAYGKYTFEGPMALQFVFPNPIPDPKVPDCKGTVSFASGSVEQAVNISCPYAPKAMLTPFALDIAYAASFTIPQLFIEAK